MELRNIQVNDIVQIVDESHPWFPSLMIVSELKSWGVQCYCHIPKSNAKNDTVQAYNRLSFDKIKLVGRAVVVCGTDV